MFTQGEPMITRKDHKRLVENSLSLKRVEDSADLSIRVGENREILSAMEPDRFGRSRNGGEQFVADRQLGSRAMPMSVPTNTSKRSSKQDNRS